MPPGTALARFPSGASDAPPVPSGGGPTVYTPYLLVLTMFSGAGEVVDPAPHASRASCEAELDAMRAAVELEWAEHGILRTRGECRDYDARLWKPAAGVRPVGGSEPTGLE